MLSIPKIIISVKLGNITYNSKEIVLLDVSYNILLCFASFVDELI